MQKDNINMNLIFKKIFFSLVKILMVVNKGGTLTNKHLKYYIKLVLEWKSNEC